jgi:hypothetical protein
VSAGRTVVVAEAADAIEAGIWLDALREAGIEARWFERGAGAALGGATLAGVVSYPVVVPAEAIGSARSVIANLGGARNLAPVSDAEALRARQQRILVIAGAGLGVALAFAVALRVLFG